MSDETIIVEGRWAVEGLFGSSIPIREVVVEEGRHSSTRAEALFRGINVREIDSDAIAAERGYEFHRGIYAVAERPAPSEPSSDFLEDSSDLVIPVDLADAGNLGNIIRSAASLGADGVLVGAGRGADPWNPKCVRASGTGIFRLPVFESASLEHSLDLLQESGFVLIGLGNQAAATSLISARRARRTALLIGPEESGLPPGIESRCDEIVSIPMSAGMDSLNAAAAAAAAMYEFFVRQEG